MNRVKQHFSIKDLENLSGIKAHTIRIWEKRYNLLVPNRTDTNIRYYSLNNLQKLLNIVLLYENGYKISKIAKIAEEKIPLLARELVSDSATKSHYINAFKIAMINFDRVLFSDTYNELAADTSFRDIFHNVFIPLLRELGLLWQTHTIAPSHEHFITNLIKQKIVTNTEKLSALKPVKRHKTYVLYLPEDEIHEIGLLYLNYEIMFKGYHTIYLGQAVPIESLKSITLHYSDIIFISYFTVEPNKYKIAKYIADFDQQINTEKSHQLWILGRQISHLTHAPSFVRTFEAIEQLIKVL